MDNPLKKTVSEMAEKFRSEEHRALYKEGAHDALLAVRGYLAISSHLSDTVKVSDLQDYISQIDC